VFSLLYFYLLLDSTQQATSKGGSQEERQELNHIPDSLSDSRRCRQRMLNAINIAKYVIFRQHAVNKMWHSATDVARSVVCLSVCVGYTHVPGKNC